MDDVTPLNLEDSPKLFGLRYDQLVWITASLIASTQFYSLMNPMPVLGHDLRLYISIFLGLIGPVYCLATLNHSSGHWETLLNFYVGSSIYIPGPDPNPTRFLLDEKLPEFGE